MEQMELKAWLITQLKESGYEVIAGDGYVYAKGIVPVLLVAHMDTVHKKSIKNYIEFEKEGKHILTSTEGIGGDDRCGIYMILEIIKTQKCSVLFCEDEETGCVGSRKFCKTEYIDEVADLNYMIELDRAHEYDAVFYDCDNPDFTAFILENTGFQEKHGSFTDISYLAPTTGIAAVNLSCGYYHAHTTSEEVVIEEMLNTIKTVKQLVSINSSKFEYIEAYKRFSDNAWGNWRDYIYDEPVYYEDYKNNKTNKTNDLLSSFPIVLIAVTEKESYVSEGSSYFECWYYLFKNNPNLCFNDIVSFEII